MLIGSQVCRAESVLLLKVTLNPLLRGLSGGWISMQLNTMVDELADIVPSVFFFFFISMSWCVQNFEWEVWFSSHTAIYLFTLLCRSGMHYSSSAVVYFCTILGVHGLLVGVDFLAFLCFWPPCMCIFVVFLINSAAMKGKKRNKIKRYSGDWFCDCMQVTPNANFQTDLGVRSKSHL